MFRQHQSGQTSILLALVCCLSGLGLLFGLKTPAPVYAGVCPANPEDGGPSGVTLDECVTTTHFVVYYTADTNDSPHHISNEAQAQLLANNLETSWNRFVDDTDFGFRTPLIEAGATRMEVWVYDIPYLGVTSAGWNHMEIDAGFVRGSTTNEDDRLQTEATPLHELFHRVQYRYTGFGAETSWVVEGQAKFMEDQVFADLDNAAGTQYQLRSNGYLGNPNWDVTTASYNASLFWKYFTEQYGTATDEPERGVDAIRHFWLEGEAAGIDNTTAVEAALDAMGHPTVSFGELFSDWIVANYTKALATVPDASYGYTDDNGNPYAAVALQVDATINNGDFLTTANQAVERWGARYYRINPTAGCDVINVSFAHDSGTPIYHIMTIKSNGLVDHWSSTTPTWSKTIVNDSYDDVVAIVGGYGANAQVDVSYGCVGLTLDIVDPTTVEPAFVGSILTPEKFVVRLALTSPQNILIEGLSAQDFAISVGTQSADVVLGAYVQSQYWLLVQAPNQTSAGDYNLTASYGTASDTETNAVRYILKRHDDMLVIDRSGSMTTNDKMGAAKNAAKLFVDATADGNKLGLVSFSGNANEPDEDATLDFDLTDVTSTVRNDIKNAITGLTASGLTSIGDGLWLGHERLDLLRDPTHTCSIVLLSDGMENEERFWADIQATIVGSPCVVDTVALGPETNEVLLQDIAGLTGGDYHYVPDDNTYLKAGPDGVTGDWRNMLASTYEFIQSDVAGRERIFEVQNEVMYGGIHTYTVEIEDDMTEAVFFVNFASTSSGQAESIDIYDPQGTRINCEEPGVECSYDLPHIVVHINEPTLQTGLWQLVVHSYYIIPKEGEAEKNSPDQSQSTPFVAGVSGNTTSALHLVVGTPLGDRRQGVQVPIVALLGGTDAVRNARVMANVRTPLGQIHQVRLYDDGNHDDGAADDGVYANLFTLTGQLNPNDPDQIEGSYQVDVQTDGVPGLIGPRYAQGSFVIAKDADSDLDGLPDFWETQHGLDPLSNTDASQDPDLDELDNLGEFNAGTNPFHSDSDGGGENDGSEVTLFAQDPLSPGDDQIPAIDWVNLTPDVAANVISFAPHPDYARLRLFRSEAPDQGFVAVQNTVPPTGVYTDTNLTNNTTYYYRLMAVDSDGHRSAVSAVQMAMPQADPFPPTGGLVIINDGAESTASREVTLSFTFEEPTGAEDVTEVLISNDPSLADGTWQPFAPSITWTLSDTVTSGDMATVYVRFRDAAGNESPDIAGDSIQFASCNAAPDVNTDGSVDVQDIQLVAGSFNSTTPNPAYDLDCSGGAIAVGDITIVAEAWAP